MLLLWSVLLLATEFSPGTDLIRVNFPKYLRRFECCDASSHNSSARGGPLEATDAGTSALDGGEMGSTRA